MSNNIASAGETTFLLQGLAEGIRNDGRSRLQCRTFEIAKGVVGRANGSAHVTLAGTEVVVGVYADVQRSKRGSMCVHVDCTPAAAWAYNPTRTRGAKEGFTTTISMQLSNLYTAQRTGGHRTEDVMMADAAEEEEGGARTTPGHPGLHIPLNYAALCIGPDMAWNLNVDVMVVGCTGGNVIGAVSVAVKAALMDVMLPQVEVSLTGEVTLHNENPSSFPQAADAPLATLFLCTGSHFLVDPTQQEESVPHTAVVLGVRPDGEVCLFETVTLSTQVTAVGPIPPRDLLTVVEDGARVLVEMNAVLVA